MSTTTTATSHHTRRRRKTFIERTIRSLAEAMEHALYAEDLAHTDGLLQRLDPRVKVVGLLALVGAAALAHTLLVIIGLFISALALAHCSHIPIRTIATRVWAGTLLFTGAIAIPALFITPGPPILHLPILDWTISSTGLRSATYLITRVETAATLSLLLILTTPWTHILKALRILHIPAILIVILGMTYRYIFLLLQIAQDMFESRQSRLVGTLERSDRQRLAAASVGVLLSKSFQLSSEIYLAMISRGFRGDAYTIDEFKMTRQDWIALAAFITLTTSALWLGRTS